MDIAAVGEKRVIVEDGPPNMDVLPGNVIHCTNHLIFATVGIQEPSGIESQGHSGGGQDAGKPGELIRFVSREDHRRHFLSRQLHILLHQRKNRPR